MKCPQIVNEGHSLHTQSGQKFIQYVSNYRYVIKVVFKLRRLNSALKFPLYKEPA
jgi:hypothetical protein